MSMPKTSSIASIPGLIAFALIAATGLGDTRSGARVVVAGRNAAVSPDGTRIAFQRAEGGIFKLGVVPLAGGDVEWIENGPGMAAFPAWTPSGGLVYTYGRDSETAYAAWKGGSKSGYGLRLCANGEKKDLTTGRCRDFAPCVSSDGKTVWFATTRGVESESEQYSKAATVRLATLDLENGTGPRIEMVSPGGNNTGLASPALSPDGTKLLFAYLEYFSCGWRVFCTGVGGTARSDWRNVTPKGMSAYSPRWHPDGRTICFTGFMKGDPGWGVWVEDLETGCARRLATGENPSFSPDGGTIVYDRGGKVHALEYVPDGGPGKEER